VDVIGSVWLGGRNLVMESGSFNSFDPLWNDLDPSGYSFAGGDPINYFDPDGRFSVSAAKKIWNAGVATLDFLGHGMAAAASAESALYADMAGNAEGAERARGASQYSLNRQEMYVDAVVESYEANRQLQGSHLGAVNATFNPMYGVLVSASEVTEGYGLRPDNLGQRLDYEQKIDSASGGALDFATAATSAYGIAKAPALFRNAAPEVEVPTINGRIPINSRYAGGTHPSGVPFTSQGFPDFSSVAKAEVKIDGLTGRYRIDEAMANQSVGLPGTPSGYVWHHVEDGTTMQLVPKKIHNATKHTGGAAVIRNGGFDR
jgi:hypothetical protein